MAYKGMDLNLRSSHAWPPREAAGIDDIGPNGGPHAAWSQPARGLSDAISVDDHVLACCNSAFDAAQFHGAAEVRLEHLLHAMTRIKAAADLLEQLGIRTGQLRQESAVAIAVEAPVDTEGRGSPRASVELEDVLRRASLTAADRKAPASVADLLRALLGLGRKTAAAALLMRAAVDPSALERWRDEPRREAAREMPHSAYAHAESSSARPNNLADTLFKRLDGMEAILRTLQADVAADRRAIADALAHRSEAAGSAAPAHLQAISSALDDKLETLADKFEFMSGKIGDRLSALDKLPASDTLAYLGARIEVIEKQIGKQGKEVAEAVSNVLLEHLIKTEDDHRGAPAGSPDLAGLESSIETHLQRADEAARTHEHSLAEIYEALVKLGTNQQTLASNLNTWRVESSGDVSIISNRLEQMERNAQETLGRLDGQVQSLRLSAGGGRRWSSSFKRWLYGTTNVLSGVWRDDPASTRKRPSPAGIPSSVSASEVTPGPKIVSITADDQPAEEKKA